MLLLRILLRYYQIKTKKKEINMKRLIKFSLLVLLVSSVNATMMPRKNNNSNSNQGLARVNRELGIGKKKKQVKKLVLNKKEIRSVLHKDDLATFKKVAWEDMYETKDRMLMDACISGALKIVVYLVKEGADVDGFDSIPLYWAVASREHKMVKVLLQAGADVNKKDGRGQTPLYNTLETGDINLAKMLINAGASIDSKDNGNMDVIERGLWWSTLRVSTKGVENALKIVDFIKSVREKRERVNAWLNESRRRP